MSGDFMESSTLSPEQQKQLLKARARELAEEAAAASPVSEHLEAVEFELGSERYAIGLHAVREVSLLKELTPVPCTPPFVAGIVNLRGEIYTVIDIKKFFGLPGKGITELNRVIILRSDEMQVGILADAVCGVSVIPLADLQPTLPTLTGVRADYLRGVTPDRLIVLEPAKILSDERLIIYEEGES